MTESIRQTGNGNTTGKAVPALRPSRTRAHARRVVTERVREAGRRTWKLARHLWGLRDGPSAGAWGESRTVWRTSPPAIASLVEYTRAGDWVPGERAPILEFLGKVYGYGVAVPVSVVLYGISLLIQRPSRLGLAAVVIAIVWFFS